MRRIAVSVIFAALTGCSAGWHRIPRASIDTIPRRQQVQVWGPSGMLQLHGVSFRQDSLVGIPFTQPLDCRCQVAIAQSEVDSIRAGDPTGGFWGSFTLVGAILLVVALFSGAMDHAFGPST